MGDGRNPTEWERVRRAVTRPADPGLPGAKAVTADALKEHAHKFGPEAVQDTAASVGLRVTVDAVAPPKVRKRKR
jgi:hypothetical protein